MALGAGGAQAAGIIGAVTGGTGRLIARAVHFTALRLGVVGRVVALQAARSRASLQIAPVTIRAVFERVLLAGGVEDAVQVLVMDRSSGSARSAGCDHRHAYNRRQARQELPIMVFHINLQA